MRDQEQTRGGRKARAGASQRPRRRVPKRSHVPAEGGRAPALWRRFLIGSLSMVVLPLVLLASLAAGIGYFRLSQGPVSLNFLFDPVKRGIDRSLPGLEARFEDVILTFDDNGGLELRLKNLGLRDASGEIVLGAPQAAIGLDEALLWRLEAAPNSVELIEPRIAVTYDRDDGFRLSFARREAGQPADAPAGMPGKSGLEAQPVASSREGVRLSEILSAPPPTKGGTAAAGAASREAGTLREVGLRNATLVVNSEGRSSVWQVPRLLVDLEDRADRSIVSGSARVSSSGRIWTASFRAERDAVSGHHGVQVAVRDLVPKQVALTLPGADALEMFDQPISADITADIGADGTLVSADVALELSGTRLQLADMTGPVARLDAALLNLTYEPKNGRVRLSPSSIRTGGENYVVRGEAMAEGGEMPGNWAFQFEMVPNLVGANADPLGAAGLGPGRLSGRFDVARQFVEVTELEVSLAGGVIGLSGEIDMAAASPGSKLDGGFSGMPVARLLAIWPEVVAPGGRQWFSDNVRDGRVNGGTIEFVSGRYLPASVNDPIARGYGQFEIGLEAQDIVFDAMPGLPPVTGRLATAKFDNGELTVLLPEGEMDLGGGDVIAVREGKFVGSEMLLQSASGDTAFAFSGSASAVKTLLEAEPVAAMSEGIGLPEGLRGKISGDVRIGFPMWETFSGRDIGYDIKARLTEGQIADVFDGADIKGASIDVQLSPQAFNASGELLYNGVLAKLNWQRSFSADATAQPPLKLSAVLDRADRKQLGLELDEVLAGDLPVDVTVDRFGQPDQKVHIRADLTPVTLSVPMLGWSKPAGRKAFADGDLVSGRGGGRVISGVTVGGSDIGIEGDITLDAKGAAVAFEFPNFALDLVSRLSAKGRRKSDGVWDIEAEGRTFQGQGFFRSLFQVRQVETATGQGAKERVGFDLKAKIDNVIGFDGVSLRDVAFALSSRDNKLMALDGRGVLDGGQEMSYRLVKRGRRGRVLTVETDDSGQAFKLVGVYPNMVGGRLLLQVDLDGSGPASQVGTLWVENFRVLGDPVVSEVVGSSDDRVPSIARRPDRVVRQVFEFDSLRAPFSIGHGQIVLEDAALHGALLGATLRGKADFVNKTVDLGGTYVFLQGLNNVFAAIPLVGELLSGPRKEGIFGTNYAIRGSMARPQVYVHPLSTIAPGIFREIFQLAPDGQRVSPRGRAGETDGPAQRRRGETVAPGRTIEGWNSEMRGN